MELKTLKDGKTTCLVICGNKWFGAKASQDLLDIVTDKKQLAKLVELLEKVASEPIKPKANKATANAELIAQIVAQVLKSSK